MNLLGWPANRKKRREFPPGRFFDFAFTGEVDEADRTQTENQRKAKEFPCASKQR
jgi:hypothetical protein